MAMHTDVAVDLDAGRLPLPADVVRAAFLAHELHWTTAAALRVLAHDAAPVDRRAAGDRRRDGTLRWVEHRDVLLGELVARARSRRPDRELRLAVAEQRDAQLPALTNELRRPPARRERHRQQRRLVGDVAHGARAAGALIPRRGGDDRHRQRERGEHSS